MKVLDSSDLNGRTYVFFRLRGVKVRDKAILLLQIRLKYKM